MASHISATSPPVAAFAGAKLARYDLVAAGGAPPRHGTTLALAVPARFVASKGGRLAVVAAAAAAGPGESDDGLPSGDCEAAVSSFRMQMEVFKFSQRPIALVATPSNLLMQTASGTAKDCTLMVQVLLATKPVHLDIHKDLVLTGQAFLVVELQANQGYVKADALVDAIQGLKLVGKTFFEGANLPEYSTPVVPFSVDDVDKDSFFKELIDLFVVFYTAIYWEARKKFGFGGGGAN